MKSFMMSWNRFYDATGPLYKEACIYQYKKPVFDKQKLGIKNFYRIEGGEYEN
jgi:hypothetical protein